MSIWSFFKLGELFYIEKGKVGIKAAIPGNFPLVVTADRPSTHIEPHFEGEAICIPLVSGTGHGHASIKRLHHISGSFAVGSILCACLTKDPKVVSARYVYYLLSTLKDLILTPLMQGSSNVSLKIEDVANTKIPLPALPAQQAIVTRLDALADKIRQVEEHLVEAEAKAEHLLALRFQEIIKDAPHKSMQEIAPLVRREAGIEFDSSYPELGIRSFGKGTFHKPALSGQDVGSKRLFRIEQGDLLFSNVFAWEGAMAIAQPEDHGRFGSHRFISCVAREDVALASFLLYYLLSSAGIEKIRKASPGGAGRNRTLGLKKLMAIEVPIPPLHAQHAFVQIQICIAELKARHMAIRANLSKLMPAVLERTFGKQAQASEQIVVQHSAPQQPQSAAVLSPFPGTNRLHDKAVVASYITMRCHGSDFGKTKLAKCYYLLHERLGLSLTEEFRREAAGPWDKEQDDFLAYASQEGWLELPPEKRLPANASKGERAFKAVMQGKKCKAGADEALKLFGSNSATADALLREMKKMHWELLELWATALDAAKALKAQGEAVTAQTVREFIASVPKWVEHKLEKKPHHYTVQSIENALAALRKWQLLV